MDRSAVKSPIGSITDSTVKTYQKESKFHNNCVPPDIMHNKIFRNKVKTTPFTSETVISPTSGKELWTQKQYNCYKDNKIYEMIKSNRKYMNIPAYSGDSVKNRKNEVNDIPNGEGNSIIDLP